MFEENEVVIRMIIQAHSPSSRYVFLAPTVSLHVGYFTGTILDISNSHRKMRTTERLASMLTKGPLMIYRWKSWTRMSDNHPPPKLRGRSKHFRVIFFCSHHVERVQLTARFRRAVLVTKRGIFIRSCKSTLLLV